MACSPVDVPRREAAIAQALANKLEQRAKDRAEAAAKARAENEAFTKEFLNKAREVFELIDKDDSGSLAIDEITTAVKSDKVVKDFLKTCGDETLMFLLQPKRLDHALRELDTDGSGEVDIDEWEEAIRRGLSKRLEQLADERERRERAAAAEDEAFSAEFLFAARKVFMMIDEDDSGTLTKEEITTAVKANKEVIDFLVNCGNPNLQYLLVPARLEAALAELDTDRSGEVDLPEWEAAIESALKNKLEAKKKAREAAAAAAQREIAEFTAHFMEAAQRCFELIDKDDSGTLTKEEIVVAVKSDKEVIDFLKTCGEPNLVALTQPARLSKALDMLDTSKDGEMDMDEWMAAIKRGLAKRLDELADERERRERAAAAADEEFSAEFLNMARKVFDMIDADGGGTLSKAEIVDAVKNNDEVIKFLSNCGNENLQSLLVPSRLEHALNCLDTDSDGEITAPEWCASESETLVCLRRGEACRGDGMLR